ncbi:hypothetical protein CC86DRAFT_464844 [Ophiobolus disseminans]|uniref:HTH La-type RNA-binding domain-containing protein n=1 Tax=Ophiobolus disseminans TaxID=1469910 RepID=A0A6A7A998_9PLEO|nr:hypothetical protein CC86DRAFT_464844 [Ophiobolus disseminans]
MTTASTQQIASALASHDAVTGTGNNTDFQASGWDTDTEKEIRRQVEYYFSDENLPHDLHMLQCCGGRKNEPVSISRICGFKRMRNFKPKRNVAAVLRQSPFLEVSDDGKLVKRKVPLQGLCRLDEEYQKDPPTGDSHPKHPRSVDPNKKIQQTKTVYPEGMTKNMMKPTGFESTYIEPPMMPAEAANGQDAYSLENPFDERMQFAIQNFKEKRRMHEMYAHVFNKLMRFGGLECSLRVGQGVSNQELAELTDKGEKTRRQITHYLPEDHMDEKKWVVDFAGLAKSFLSSWYSAHYGYAPNTIKNACQVPRSFYNFLRYHNVCPEYDEQLAEALKICDIAEQELPKVYAAGLALPGDFNKSASALFGGAYAGLYAGDKSWAEDMKKGGIQIDQIGIRSEEARIKFGAGVAIMGSDEQGAWLDSLHLETFEHVSASLKTLEHITAGLEVVRIELPSEDTTTLYREQSKISDHKVGGQLEPLGKLFCETWHADDCYEWDLPENKYPDGKPRKATAGRTYEFWMEKSTLEECFVGLKMDAKILVLEGGIAILDDVRETMCSFFTWLPNELWMDRKPKKVIWLPKGLADGDDEVVGEVQANGQAKCRAEAPGGDPFDDEVG